MIFSSDFDRTLWFMLVSDKKNRNDIAEFIKNIPEELYDRINQELDRCSIDASNSSMKKLTKAFRNKEGDTTYFYTVSLNSKLIIVNLSIWKQTVDDYQEVMQISLYPLTLEQIKNVDKIIPEYIGDYYHTCSKMSFIYNTVVFKGNDRGYELIDGNCYDVIVQSVDGDLEKVIDIERIPNEIHLDDLIDKRNINRLVRNRRR